MGRTARRRAACLGGLAALVSVGLALVAVPAGAVTVSTEAELQTAFANAAETSIVLANSIDLTCAGGGDLDRNSATPLTVDGNGFTIRQTCPGERVMQQDGSGPLTLNAVTITGGTNASPDGGGIESSAPVTLNNALVTGNATEVNGGGIHTNGMLTITSSRVTNNTAGNDGGGASVQVGALNVTDSTFSGNTSTNGSGGAAFRDGSSGGDVTLLRSTFNGNQAPKPGQGSGAIDSLRPLTAINATVTGNSGNTGGLSVAGGGNMTLVYATVVGNTSLGGAANLAQASASIVTFGSVIGLPQGGPNCGFSGATTTSNGFNFSDDASCALTSTGDSQNGGNPALGALAGNGGPTQTRLPQPSSPLVDAIPAGSCQADGAAGITTDQRGLPRPAMNGCDIGAVEVHVASPGPPAPVPVVVAPRFTG